MDRDNWGLLLFGLLYLALHFTIKAAVTIVTPRVFHWLQLL